MKGSTTYDAICADIALGVESQARLAQIHGNSKASAKTMATSNEKTATPALHASIHALEDNTLKTLLFKTVKAHKGSRNAKYDKGKNHAGKFKGNHHHNTTKPTNTPSFDPSKHTFNGNCNWCGYFGHSESDCRIKKNGGQKGTRAMVLAKRNAFAQI